MSATIKLDYNSFEMERVFFSSYKYTLQSFSQLTDGLRYSNALALNYD